MLPTLHRFSHYGKKFPSLLPWHLDKILPQDAAIGFPMIKAMSKYFDLHKEGLDGKRKVVVHPFNFPPEILHALGVAPIVIEAISTIAASAPVSRFPDHVGKYLDFAKESGLPGTLCPGQLGGAAAILYGDLPKPDLIICGAPGFCDVNSKILEYTARTLDIPLMYIDISPYHNERGLAYFRNSFKEIIGQLEDFTGNKLDEDRLRQVVKNSNKMTALADEILDLQALSPSPVPNLYLFMNVGMRVTMAGRPEALGVYKAALKSAKEKLRKGKGALRKEKVRAIWLYTSIYFDPGFMQWIKKIGMASVIDILAYFPVKPIDTTNMDTMLDGLAEMGINYPMARQMKGAADDIGSWVEDMVYLSKKFNVDCAIFSGNPACKRACGFYKVLSDRLKNELGVPSLTLDADSWDRRVTSIPAVKEKIETFLETIA